MPGITPRNSLPLFAINKIQIATVLFLITACGVTNAQQSGSNNGAVNQNGQSPQPTAQSAPQSAQRLGPLEMVLNDQLIASFKTQGQLSALVEPREFVNEILFLYEGNHDHHDNHGHDGSAGNDVTGVMTPVAKIENILAFELDDFDLETIKTRGLKYRFDQYERGRYESVRVDYKRAAAGGNGKVTNNNNLGGSGRTDSNLIDNRQPNRFFPVPAPEYFTPGDQNFMGPAMQPVRRNANQISNNQRNPNQLNPNSNFVTRETTQRNQTASRPTWDPSPTPGNQFNNQFNNQNDTNRQPQQNNGQIAGNGQFTNNGNTGNNNTGWNNQRTNFGQNQPSNTPQNNFGQNSRGQNNFAQNQPNNNQPNNNQQYQPNTHQPYQPNNYQQNQSNPAMLANEAARKNQQDIDFRQARLVRSKQLFEDQKLAVAEQELERNRKAFIAEQQRIENEREQAKLETRNAYDSFQSLASTGGNRPNTGRGNYGDTLTTGYRSPPKRTGDDDQVTQPTNGVRGMNASIQGPNDKTAVANNGNRGLNQAGLISNANNNKTESLVYFMLLFSLGLNIYLGWIARGFYVRYNELADELRETFTATM